MGTSGSSDDEYALWLSPTGQLSGAFNGPSQQKTLQAKSSLTLNTWTHVVFMWNKVDSKVSFYINGILDTITNSTITSIQNSSAVLRIGAWVQSSINSFTGSIDDIRIYNRALSDQEILQLYYPAITEGLVAYYPFDGNANDTSGNGNNGNVYNLTQVNDRFGNPYGAYKFDGITDHYISLPDLGLGNSSTEKTFCSFFKLESENINSPLSIIGQWLNTFQRWHLTISTNQIVFYERDGSDNQPYTISVNIDTTDFHFITAICSDTYPTGQKIKIYLDAQYLGAISSYNLRTFTGNYNVGRYGQSSYSPVYGIIDDIRIYNRALTIEEIQVLYGSTVDIKIDENLVIDDYYLSQNYPNPFNPSTKISYKMPIAGMVTLKVYDVLGNEVATLVNEEKMVGYYEVEYKASYLASGIYFYRLQAGSSFETKKMILLK